MVASSYSFTPKDRNELNRLFFGYVIAANKEGLKSPKGMEVTKLHPGGQRMDNPHPAVLEVLKNVGEDQTGILGYLKKQADNDGIPLAEYLQNFTPENGYFVNLPEVYEKIYERLNWKVEGYEQFLEEFATNPYRLTPYRGQKSGNREENKAIMASYFENCGIPSDMDNIIMGNDGFKSIWAPLCVGLFTEGVGESRVGIGGSILAPKGHYQTTVITPGMFGGRVNVVEQLNAESVEKALEDRGDLRAIYLSTVANPDGKIIDRETLEDIARVVLTYNNQNPHNPVYVIADEVYRYSEFSHEKPTHSIASISGEDVGSPTLGHMNDYTITITSTSKTFGAAAVRFGAATTGNDHLKEIIYEARKDLSFGDISPFVEIPGVSTFALTPREWVRENNGFHKDRLEEVRQYIHNINERCGKEFLEMEEPEGGFYVVLKVKKENLPSGINSSMDLSAYCAFYGHKERGTGVSTVPGCLYGYEEPDIKDDGYYYLRTTLAKYPEELKESYRRIGDACEKLVALKEKDVLYHRSDEIRSILEHAYGGHEVDISRTL